MAAKSDKASSVAEKSPPFEEMMSKLEAVVEELEGGSLSLDEAFEKYQVGMELLRGCSKTLDAMEQRIEILEKEGQVPRPFEGAGEDGIDDRKG